MENNLKMEKYITSLVVERNASVYIDGIKIQKIIFILDCYVNDVYKSGWNEVLKNDCGINVIKNLSYEAWQHGPVNQTVYSFLNENSKDNILKISRMYKASTFKSKIIEKTIETIIDGLKDKSTWSLVDFTHQFSEWKNKYDMKKSLYDNHEIDFEKILREFKMIKNKTK